MRSPTRRTRRRHRRNSPARLGARRTTADALRRMATCPELSIGGSERTVTRRRSIATQGQAIGGLQGAVTYNLFVVYNGD